MPGIGEEQGTAAVFQEFPNLVSMESSIEGNSSAACSDRSQIGCSPARVIVGENSDPRARLLTLVYKPSSNGFGHAPQVGAGIALQSVAALHFKRYVAGPALLAGHKLVVKGWHLRRNLT